MKNNNNINVSEIINKVFTEEEKLKKKKLFKLYTEDSNTDAISKIVRKIKKITIDIDTSEAENIIKDTIAINPNIEINEEVIREIITNAAQYIIDRYFSTEYIDPEDIY